jgi:hypothetical protein
MPKPTKYRLEFAERILQAVSEGASLNAGYQEIGVARAAGTSGRMMTGTVSVVAETGGIERYRAWEDDLLHHARGRAALDEHGHGPGQTHAARHHEMDHGATVPEIWASKSRTST